MSAPMLQTNRGSSVTYTYSSQPRAMGQVAYDKLYENIMYDKHIVRGNTYAISSLPASSQLDPLELQRQQEAHRRSLARKRAREQFKPRSPLPVEGRKHIDVQTELYLESITDRIEEADVKTQTDAFLDRPATPLFIPAKTGRDVATQIEDDDLFDFNVEVKPILEVLVGKTVEQALLEVMEEEELANLRAQQRIFEENRNAELVETQRLEEQERRRQEEKERRVRQQRDALLMEKETAGKIAARAFAQSYLSDLVPAVFATLNHSGFFYDPVEREVETVFMPWLMDEAEKALDTKLVARMVLDVLIRELVKNQQNVSVIKVPSSTEKKITTSEAKPTTPEGTTEPSDNTVTEKESQGSSHSNIEGKGEEMTEDGIALKGQENEPAYGKNESSDAGERKDGGVEGEDGGREGEDGGREREDEGGEGEDGGGEVEDGGEGEVGGGKGEDGGDEDDGEDIVTVENIEEGKSTNITDD